MKTNIKVSLKRTLAAVLTVGCMISGCISPVALAAGPAPAAPNKTSSAPAPQQPEQKKKADPQKPANNTPAKGVTVYVNNGHYHSSAGCSEIHGSSQRMSIDDAKRKGYKPCDKCYGGAKAPAGNPKAKDDAELVTAIAVGGTVLLTAIELASNAGNSSAAVKIPADAYEWGGHYYYVYNGDSLDVTSWESAKKYCEDLGGHLAVISSPEENSALYSYITSIDKPNAYFGYSDRANEGNWTWVDGSAVSYTNWQSWQPGSESNDYAMFYWKNTSGTWNGGDFGGNTGRNFICEWE